MKEKTVTSYTRHWKHKRPYGKRVENKKLRKNAKNSVKNA